MIDYNHHYSQPNLVAIYAGPSATGFKDATDKFYAPWDDTQRFEIDDSRASLGKSPMNMKARFKGGRRLKLKDLLKHEELYKQYPGLANTKVTGDLTGESAGMFYPDTGAISINPAYLDARPESAEYIKSALLHEAQHAVQKKEGFLYSKGDPKEDVYHQPGEIEAYDTQARMNYTSNQRRKLKPYSNYINLVNEGFEQPKPIPKVNKFNPTPVNDYPEIKPYVHSKFRSLT